MTADSFKTLASIRSGIMKAKRDIALAAANLDEDKRLDQSILDQLANDIEDGENEAYGRLTHRYQASLRPELGRLIEMIRNGEMPEGAQVIRISADQLPSILASLPEGAAVLGVMPVPSSDEDEDDDFSDFSGELAPAPKRAVPLPDDAAERERYYQMLEETGE